MQLSIITPTLNPGPILSRAVESVLHQSFDDFEHIIVDGGSSDGTLELLRAYPHLRILAEADDGIFDAMNKGVAASTGEWIYFLGADDKLIDQDVLSDLNVILNRDYDVIYGDVYSAEYGGRYDGPFDQSRIRTRNICHQAIFTRRRVFQLVGHFDQTYPGYADWDHNMRWVLNPEVRRHYVDRVIADYADGGFSSLNPDNKFQKDRLYKYLLYGRRTLPKWSYYSTWCKEFGKSVLSLDGVRTKRVLKILTR